MYNGAFCDTFFYDSVTPDGEAMRAGGCHGIIKKCVTEPPLYMCVLDIYYRRNKAAFQISPSGVVWTLPKLEWKEPNAFLITVVHRWFTMKRVAVSGFAKIAGALRTIPVKKWGLSIAHMMATVPPWKENTIRGHSTGYLRSLIHW